MLPSSIWDTASAAGLCSVRTTSRWETLKLVFHKELNFRADDLSSVRLHATFSISDPTRLHVLCSYSMETSWSPSSYLISQYLKNCNGYPKSVIVWIVNNVSVVKVKSTVSFVLKLKKVLSYKKKKTSCCYWWIEPSSARWYTTEFLLFTIFKMDRLPYFFLLFSIFLIPHLVDLLFSLFSVPFPVHGVRMSVLPH